MNPLETACKPCESAGGEAMLNSLPQGKKNKFRLNRKTFGLTYSCPKNLSANPLDFEYIKNMLEDIGKCKYVISEEKHEDGKLHYHIWIEYKKKIDTKNERFFDLKDVHPKIEKLKDEEHWCDYIRKYDNYITNCKDIDIPSSFSISLDLYEWEKRICDKLDKIPNNRDIWVVVGKNGGEGKTTFQKWLCLNYPHCICLSGKASDMKHCIVEYKKTNKCVPKIILINVPRSNIEFVSFTGIEEIKDMFFYSGKYEGGMINDRHPHVIIFCNEILDPEGDKMSKDRWHYMDITETINPLHYGKGPIDEYTA